MPVVLARLSSPRGLRAVFLVAATVAVALSFPILWHQTHAQEYHRLVDLEVYRDAGRSLLDGRTIYTYRTPPPQLLPFTYPPFAAVISVPLALVSFTVAGWLWVLACLGIFAGLVAYAFRPAVRGWRGWLAERYGDDAAALATAAFTPLLLPVVVWLEPVRMTFRFGQVNIFIIAIVVADCCLRRPPWPRGVGVGLATAVKLTPGLFVPYLWLTGRRRAAYVATATFFVCQGLAVAVIPQDSVHYWTDAFFSSSRLGNNRQTANIAVRGALLRWFPPKLLFPLLVVLLVGAVLFVGLIRAVRASQQRAELGAVTLVGLTTIAVSPVSWDHHAVWVVLALALLVADPTKKLRLLLAVALAAWFYTRIPWWTSPLARTAPWPVKPFFRLLNQSFTWLVVALIVALPTQVPAAVRRVAGRRPADGLDSAKSPAQAQSA
jgi:alpha-1,2-mannosyltransferase